MSVPKPLYSLSASEALKLLISDVITAEQYVRSLFERIDKRDAVVNGWAYLDRDHVINQAKTLDQLPRDKRRSLHGLPIAFKDMIDTKDMPTQYGSVVYKNNQPSTDASCVALLRDAGAIIMGKTTIPELLVNITEITTTNPHDPARAPGASSFGSAALVADYQVPLSMGGQVGGSLAYPASFNGIYAWKPSHANISTQGVRVLCNDVDTLGFFSRDINDFSLLAPIFAIKEYDNVSNSLAPLHQPQLLTPSTTRVAVIHTPGKFFPDVGKGTITAMQRTAEILSSHGIQVDQIDLPERIFPDLARLKSLHRTVWFTGLAVSLLRNYRLDSHTKPHLLSQGIRDRMELAPPELPSQRQRAEAANAWSTMRGLFDGFAQQYAAVIVPSALDVAPRLVESSGSDAVNFVWTQLHVPLVQVPAFKGEGEMPVGVSVVAGRYRDLEVLRVCALLDPLLMKDGGWTVGGKLLA